MTTGSRKFGRSAELTITNLVDNTQIVVKGLRVTFSITKSDKAGDNKAQITIYNLATQSRELIQTQVDKAKKPQTHVELRCGYASDPTRVLFRGIGEVVSSRKPPNWETKITCEDGVQELKSEPYEKKFPAGTTVSTIINDMLASLGISKTAEVPVTATIPKARAFSGDPLANIQDLQDTYGFEFDIQEQGALLRPKNERLPTATLTTLGRDSGMINSPRVKGGIVVCDALLDPNLRPGNYVKLTTEVVLLNGEYVIKRATYKGDTWSGDWKVSLELEDAPPSVFQPQSQIGVLA